MPTITGLIILIMLLTARSAQAAEPPILTMLFFPFPPFNATDDSGQPVGTLVERFRDMAQRAGYQARFRMQPPARARQSLVAGEGDVMLTAGGHAEMGDKVLTGPLPIAELRIFAYKRGPENEIRTPEDLRGQRVILLRNFSYSGLTAYIQDPANGVAVGGEAPTNESAVQMLADGRAPVLIQYDNNFEAAVRRLGLPRADFQGNQLLRTDIYIHVTRMRPDARQVLDRLQAAATAQNEQGALAGTASTR